MQNEAALRDRINALGFMEPQVIPPRVDAVAAPAVIGTPDATTDYDCRASVTDNSPLETACLRRHFPTRPDSHNQVSDCKIAPDVKNQGFGIPLLEKLIIILRFMGLYK